VFRNKGIGKIFGLERDEVKAKGKVVPVLNQAPRGVEVSGQLHSLTALLKGK
jgi:hypothetical protein